MLASVKPNKYSCNIKYRDWCGDILFVQIKGVWRSEGGACHLLTDRQEVRCLGRDRKWDGWAERGIWARGNRNSFSFQLGSWQGKVLLHLSDLQACYICTIKISPQIGLLPYHKKRLFCFQNDALFEQREHGGFIQGSYSYSYKSWPFPSMPS